MSGAVIEVPPRSRKWIRAYGWQLREACGLMEPWFPVVEFMELALPKMMSGFVFDIGSEREMGKQHGQTWPDEKHIRIRQDVYDRAHEGHGRDRATVAHEVGHLLLHGGLPMARTIEQGQVPPYRDSEWQAKCFAGELLFPAQMAKDYPMPGDAAEAFGVSLDSANYQLQKYKEDGLI